MRRKMRGAALTVLAGMMIVAGAELAPVPHSPGDGVREEAVLAVAAALPPIAEAGDKAANKSMPVTMAASILVTDRFVRSRAQASCDDLSGSFLAPRCRFGKAGKLRVTRSARPAHPRVGAVPIGRPDAAFQVEQQGAAASRSAPAAETAPAAVAANEASSVLPPEKPAAKKPVKSAHKQAPSRDNAGANSLAAAPLPGFGLFGPFFHEPPRNGHGAWAMSW